MARVRVLCRDRAGRLLLLRWRDPVDGHVFFEPPGGGIEKGEEARAAAERELYEETGYRLALPDAYVVVPRDYRFAGRHFVHDEAFFVADVEGEPTAAAFTEQERSTFLEWRFVALDELEGLGDPLEPPTLGEVARRAFGARAVS